MPSQSNTLLTERDFSRVETARKTSLSQLISASCLTLSHIARGARIERRAVRRAADCDGIRFDTAVRIEYYLNWYLNGGREVEESMKKNEFDD